MAIVSIVCLTATWTLRSQASDFWGYGNYGIGNGQPDAPVFYLEVRGVGSTPTFARVVRFSGHSSAPDNALLVGQRVSAEIRTHVQNVDRWNETFTLIAGRNLEEKVLITLDQQTAKRLFAKPGTKTKDYQECVKLWEKYVAKKLPAQSEKVEPLGE